MLLLLAAAGGAIGAAARFLVNQAFAARVSSSEIIDGVPVFPWATMTVNIIGGFLMGIVIVLLQERLGGSPEWRTFLATGILGGFTTFSAFSLDMLTLMTHEGILGPRFLIYVVGSVLLAFGALLAGLTAARAVLA
jgi:fluoride exporter